MNNIKRNRTRCAPWGTPEVTLIIKDVRLLILTYFYIA